MAVKSKSQFKYVPMIQQAPLDMNFHYFKDDGTLGIKASCRLIKSINELKEISKEFEGVTIAVDTETTGLSYTDDFIVGFSISKDAYSGIYVPIRHQIKRVDKKSITRRDDDGNIMYTKAGKERKVTINEETFFECPHNLPDREALNILYNIMKKAKISLLHNSNYDLNMLKKEGYDITGIKTFDTMILPYIYDPEGRGVNGLKFLEKLALGRQVPDFKSVLGKEENFRYVDPELGYEYACFDSMGTFGVYQKLYPMVKNLLSKFSGKGIYIDGKKYNIVKKDNELIKSFVDYYDHVELKINKDVAISYREQIITDLEDVSEKIYTYFNKGQFNLSVHSKEFKAAMEEKQIVTGATTDTGNISFGKEGIKSFTKNMKALKLLLEKFDIIKFDASKLDKRGTSLQLGKVIVNNTKQANYNSVGLKLARILLIFGLPYFNMKEETNFLHVLDKKDNKLTKEDFKLILEHMYEKEKEKLEVLINIQKNSSLNKAMNSYVDKLTQVDSCRMKYKLLATSSSRLASGNGSKSDKKRKNHYYIDLNAQNLTKPHSCFYKATPCDDEDSILGWKFEEVSDDYAREHSKDEVIVEGSAAKANIRNCIVAPKEGNYVPKVTKEYANEEAKYAGVNKVYQINLKDGTSFKCTEDSPIRVRTILGNQTVKLLKEIVASDSIIGGANID